ncbi:hypothetical protein G7Y89_g14168 [Cudoniella acicularis]|uniref:Uncharacterized protein n=1 Tax=Cudoniella acicularis TaxID=354080 RepID=A0A8H4R853_9HELO|nr:hypothetical protein G7Y89_g14168 [Cudoniella acicularis]
MGPKAPNSLLLQTDAQGSLKEEAVDERIFSTRLRKFSHSLRLDSFYILFQEIRGRSKLEERKIAIIADLRSAFLVSLLHIIPTAASTTLIVLNWRGFYIGRELQGVVGEDGLKFLGLQFAAKMLELLAMASLSTIMFGVVRAQLISDSLPFGAITAGFEFTKLSLLWSKEFVATCATTFSSSTNKALLIATIIVFTMLGAGIGPSAAVASQPVLRDWPAGGTEFWLNTTVQGLWPLTLNNIAPSDLPCNSSNSDSCFPLNYNLLASGQLSLWPSTSFLSADHGSLPTVYPEKVLIAGRHSMRTMETRFRGPFIYQPDLTAVTVPSAAIADAISQISRYWFIANEHQHVTGKDAYYFYNDIVHTVEALQPVVYVRCSASGLNATVQFSRLDRGSGNYPLVSYGNTTTGSQQWFDAATGNGLSPSLSWVELPEADFGPSSVGAIVALPGTNTTRIAPQVLGCTVDARWANATTTVSFLGGPMITSGSPDNWFTGGQLGLNLSGLPLWPRVKIAPAWAEAINPIIEQPSTSVFAKLCNSLARLNSISMAPLPINAVESILVTIIADGLARTGGTSTILGSLKGIDDSYSAGEWITEFLPKNSVFGTGGSAFDYLYQVGDQSTRFEARTTVNGYGYGITTATLLSTLVLLTYSLIAVIYIIYSICFAKTTSSSWESITELVALAANSTPSSALRSTGAGIARLTTLKNQVGIRLSDNRLQMIFEDEGGAGKILPNVLPNELYS